MKLSEMKQVLAAGDLRLTKSLGQNFLHDGNQLRRIVEAGGLTAADRVLEIGPGLGPLTELLLEQAVEVLAIETDRRLVEVLRTRFAVTPKLTLLHDDALDYLRREARDWSGWKLVANLPYSIASPLIVELAQARGGPERLVVTLQLEVARRLMAAPGGGDYGVLTLLVQMSYEPVEWFKIPAGCFFPEPEVDSACVVLQRRATALLPEAERGRFIKIVKRGFSQRRKMMLKLLKQDWSAELLAEAFEQVGLSAQIRAEAVSLEQFARLTEILSASARRVSALSEEIFDVVNERDEVIGRQTRGEVHRLGLKHRAVHVLVFNARGELFLQKRSQFKDTFPGAWDSSAAGHLNSGEDYDACAVREVREELGLELRACPERILRIEPCVETGQEFVWVYRCDAEGPFELPPEEIERGDWFAPDAVTRWMAERPGDFASALLWIWKMWHECGR